MLGRGKLNIIIDGQFGSTGKGLLAAYVGTKFHVDVAMTNGSPNAGHTFYVDDKKPADGKKRPEHPRGGLEEGLVSLSTTHRFFLFSCLIPFLFRNCLGGVMNVLRCTMLVT